MKKILLVSENSDKIKRLAEFLSAKSYLVDLAISGGEAIKRAVKGLPDAILIDASNINKTLFKSQLAQNEFCGHIPVVDLNQGEFDDFELAEIALTKRLRKLRVLVAEDDRQMADVFHSVIEHSGFEVKTSYDGAETLAIIKSWRPDLLVLDIMLPIIDGFHICRMINEDPGFEPRPKILIVSGRSSDLDQNLGAACGAEEYLVKPVNNLELVKKINKILYERE